MQHNVRHTDRRLDKDHWPSLRLVPEAVPDPKAKVIGPFPANVCGSCGATVEVVAEKVQRVPSQAS